jgi:hypothetical protein
MSWNGTVRCGHCYGRGHNRRGCPQLKAQVEANPDSFLAQNEKYKKEIAKVRSCSWCKEPGHNVKTCRHKKEGQNKLNELASHMETQLNHILSIAGIGRGALLKKKDIIRTRADETPDIYGTVLSGSYTSRQRLSAMDNDHRRSDAELRCPVTRNAEPMLWVHWSNGVKEGCHLPTLTKATQELLTNTVGAAAAWEYWGYTDIEVVVQSNQPLKVETSLELYSGQVVDTIDSWIGAVKESVKKCEDYKKSVKNA